jgi:hypothetical protein
MSLLPVINDGEFKSALSFLGTRVLLNLGASGLLYGWTDH